jgi:uncharacterized membrane protein YcaP (DUF421 family)
MRSSHLSEQDLRSALRVQSQIEEPSGVKVARLERSGSISVIPVEGQPHVIEYPVEEGVKVIRIEIGE